MKQRLPAQALGKQRDPEVARVFVGLVLGMLTASLNLMLIAPVMPTIAADFGALDHYSWLALSSMVSSSVAMPVIGKLSDGFGRKPFYILGVVLIAAGSILCGVAPSFEFLLAARVVQGFGTGSIFLLSLTIMADIISPLQRGKYQGIMGAVYGAASLLGPLTGGLVAQFLSWRWLFFLSVPLSLTSLAIVQTYLHLRPFRRASAIDFMGIGTLTLALVSFLLAIDRGGATAVWSAPQVTGLLGLAAASGALFFAVEKRAADPVMPLRLWSDGLFRLANIANMGVAIGMFTISYFVPLFVQGVMGGGAARSGAALVPLSLTSIGAGIAGGQVISRTGRYKALTLSGLAIMALAFGLMARMGVETSELTLGRNLLVLGIGLGLAVQNFRLIVQNLAHPSDMGAATATTELCRSLAAVVGVGVMGSLITHRLQVDLTPYWSLSVAASPDARGSTAGLSAVLDSGLMSQLPPAVTRAIRARVAAALHPVFVGNLVCATVAFGATLALREVPLRHIANATLQRAFERRRS